MAIKDVKNVKNISWGTVGSVMVGISLLGAAIYLIRRAPSNAVTDPLKRGADVITQ